MLDPADAKRLAKSTRRTRRWFTVADVNDTSQRLIEAGLPLSLTSAVVEACSRTGEQPWYVIDALVHHVEWEAILAEGPMPEAVLA